MRSIIHPDFQRKPSKTPAWLPMLRLAIIFAAIPISYLIGLATDSSHAFVVSMAVCLLISIVLRLTLLSDRRFIKRDAV